VSVTISEVQQIARLARLSFTPDEERALLRDLNMILTYMEDLNGVPTEDVEPLAHVGDLTNAFRADTPRPGLPADEVFLNAPQRSGDHFAVPRVIADR
jgi:aspartyl-tRNA(Asn)/glutamyl-tRNA(Gln) amidotransferase subunit C